MGCGGVTSSTPLFSQELSRKVFETAPSPVLGGVVAEGSSRKIRPQACTELAEVTGLRTLSEKSLRCEMQTRDGLGPRYLVVGKIVAPWGVRGEVKVAIETDFPQRFQRLKRVYLGEKAISFVLEGSRLHKGHALLKLGGCDDRDAAQKLRGQLVQIPIEEAMPLGEDEYYVHQIVGLDVWTTEEEHLGRVSEVLFTGANDVYVVQGEKGEILIPAVEDVVEEVDLAGGRLIIELIEGLI